MRLTISHLWETRFVRLRTIENITLKCVLLSTAGCVHIIILTINETTAWKSVLLARVHIRMLVLGWLLNRFLVAPIILHLIFVAEKVGVLIRSALYLSSEWTVLESFLSLIRKLLWFTNIRFIYKSLRLECVGISHIIRVAVAGHLLVSEYICVILALLQIACFRHVKKYLR